MRWKKVSRFGMKLALSQLEGPKKLISFDIGSMNTGVAVSCPHLERSYLLKIIKSPSDSPIFIKKARQIIGSQQNVKGIIVGKPLFQGAINQINNRIDYVTKIMQQSKSQNQILYCFEDQNWTTKQAQAKIRQFKDAIRYQGHLHNEKDLEDGIAAMKILERFLAYYNNNEE